MTRKYALKTLGTSALGLMVVGVLLFSTGTAQALFRFIGAELRTAGTVTTVGSSSFELRTSGSTWPITVITDGSTSFAGGYTTVSDIVAGDEVNIVADRSSGEFIAIEVTKSADPSLYGSAPCDSFAISTAIFERPVNNTFYVVKDNIGVVINSDNNTQVVGGTFEDLLPGTEVIVSGFDCRSTDTLTAQTIEIVNNDGLALCDSFGDNAIVVRNREVLLAHDESSSRTKEIATNIPAGRYRVHGVSFDNHSTSPWDTQTNERWYAIGSTASTQTLTTGSTNDLPNGIDYNQTVLLNDVEVEDIDSMQFVHAATVGAEGYQSVYPICTVFEPLEEVFLPEERLQ